MHGCGSDPGYGLRPPSPARVHLQPETRPAWVLRHPARRTISLPAARKCTPCYQLQTERRFRTRPLRCSAHNANLAPAAAGTRHRQDSPSPNSGSSSSHRSPAVLAVAFAIACERRGRGKRGSGSVRGCRRWGVALSRAAPCRPGRGGRGEHCGRGASERDSGALYTAWARLWSRD